MPPPDSTASQSSRTDALKVAEISSWVVAAIDDEMDNLTLVTKVLTFNGATVHTAFNGALGLELVRQVRPTLILLDLSMPVMDGWAMVAALRADPNFQKTPVIALTAHAMVGDKERILAGGFDGYISKPFRISTFLGEIIRCLTQSAQQA
ncbi:MAG: response regulator [Anaerolineae bacterium]|nr:response regulator [Anaerolineae bacterium]NUQ02890.1 response regulator [Anaerolineae bacterium]